MGQTILTPNQQQLLEHIIAASEITDHFYLTGGTALSEFYFQHRLSEDFDFFGEKPLVEKDVLFWVKTTAQKLKIENVEYKTFNGQLVFLFHFPQSVAKVDFAQYPFPHLGEFKKHYALKIASILDIGVNKLQAIQTRKRGRDFFDLYYILTNGQHNYRNKFDITLSTQEVAKHFMGILEAIDQPRFLGKVDWNAIEKFFIEEAKRLTDDLLSN